MDYSIAQNGDAIAVSMTGRLDANSAPKLDEALASVLVDTSQITFDLAGVDYISSAGLRTLLIAFKRVAKNGGMKLINVQPEIMEVLQYSGFADIFDVQ